jgi:hypothetical protein
LRSCGHRSAWDGLRLVEPELSFPSPVQRSRAAAVPLPRSLGAAFAAQTARRMPGLVRTMHEDRSESAQFRSGRSPCRPTRGALVRNGTPKQPQGAGTLGRISIDQGVAGTAMGDCSENTFRSRRRGRLAAGQETGRYRRRVLRRVLIPSGLAGTALGDCSENTSQSRRRGRRSAGQLGESKRVGRPPAATSKGVGWAEHLRS